ncbi:HD domain-containing protein [Candidatus Woesearchaeota archaeon]|nr:HD domain-containing protein [Candidatus Woesearchaeota archaeon]
MEDSTCVRKVRELVCSEFPEDDWKFHVSVVYGYAVDLAEKLSADMEIVQLSALLHDIGRLRHGGKDHDITGAQDAEKMLGDLGYPKDRIDKIAHCIRSHRGSKSEEKPATLEAEILSNADAMAHMDVMPWFFHVRAHKTTFEEMLAWMEKKLERTWDKMTLDIARDMSREKYETLKKVLAYTTQHR